MKKTLTLLVAMSLAAGLLVACSKTGPNSTEANKDAENQTEVLTDKNLSSIDVEKYVTKIGEYKGMELNAPEKKVITDEEVNSYIDYLLSTDKKEQEVTGRAVQDGDIVNIDYVGKKDGAAFDGGTAEGQDLQIGSGTFIEGFEDGLIGSKIGDVVELNLTFPEEYHTEDLAGQAVVFTVTVNKITELVKPELNDEYVASLAIEDVKTVDDYKNYIKKSLEDSVEASLKNTLHTQVTDLLIEQCEFADNPPEGLYNYYKDMILNSFKKSASGVNMELVDYVLTYYGMTEEQFNTEIEAGAKDSANQAMACALVAKKEGITVTDEELEKNIQENYANFGYETAEEYKATGLAEDYRDYLLTAKVLDFLVDEAVITEVKEEALETTVEEETSAEEKTENETEMNSEVSD